jgi:hypothetical protein
LISQRQDADLIQRLLTLLGVHFQAGRLFRARHMRPAQLPLHPQSRLIAVNRLVRLDLTRHYLFQRGLTVRTLLEPMDLRVLRTLNGLQGVPYAIGLLVAVHSLDVGVKELD